MIRLIREKINQFFAKGHERTILTKKNIVASFGVKGITILITLVMTPMTIDYLDRERYGIFVALTSMVAWLSLFDIGFGNGLRNCFAEAKARGEMNLAKSYVSSTYAIVLLLWIVIFSLFAVLNSYLDWPSILKVSPEYSKEITDLMWISVSAFGFIFVLRLLSSIVTADQRPAIASFIDMIGQLITLIGVFLLVKTTDASLVRIGIVIGFSPVLVYIIASVFLFNRNYKAFKPSIKCVDFKLAGNMMNLGVKFFIATVASFMISHILSFLIIRVSGPEQAANYDTAYKIFSVTLNAMAIVIIPYWTSFTDAYVLKDYTWMKNSMKRLYQMFALFVAFQALILLFSGFIYNLWIGDRLEISFYLSLSVFVYVLVLCWNNINIYPINGIGKVQLQLYSSLCEVLLLFPLAYFMSKHLGTIGIVLTPVIIYIPRMIWAPIQLNKLINQKATGLWNK
ncbi:MATE family efflux transporter [Bacteroidales bacterium OttesenSCG-928-M11]|nr:MATE family efflux transporter [Bacteroidales bacterium OttesenSCG-928-M11]